jgi:hypothetical protein
MGAGRGGKEGGAMMTCKAYSGDRSEGAGSKGMGAYDCAFEGGAYGDRRSTG